jgi:hypothetical protein
MGCDIHMVLEKRINGKWVTTQTFDAIESWNGFASPIARNRNYERFARLAGVRGDGPEPRGIPDDLSETGRYHVDVWSGDGHSHSWLPLKDAVKVFAETEHKKHEPNSTATEYPTDYYFGVSDDDSEMDDYRVVFWFDN